MYCHEKSYKNVTVNMIQFEFLRTILMTEETVMTGLTKALFTVKVQHLQHGSILATIWQHAFKSGGLSGTAREDK